MAKEQKFTRNLNLLLRQARLDERWTQAELANKVADELTRMRMKSTVDEQTVRRWERLEHFPSAGAREALCNVFKKSANELGLLWELYHPANGKEKADLTQATIELEQEENEGEASTAEDQSVFSSVPPSQENQEEDQHVSLPVPPSQGKSPRKNGWLLASIITNVVLLGVIGVMIIPRQKPANPTSSVDFAATATVAVAACAAAPTLVEPVDGQTLSSRTVIFTWEAPTGCAPDGYTVRITRSYDHETKPWIVDIGWAPTDYKYTFSEDGTYYWHIRACKPCTPFNPGRWITRIFTIHTSSKNLHSSAST